ncbi:MAG: hypothetical protein U0610_12825 [bacterium]
MTARSQRAGARQGAALALVGVLLVASRPARASVEDLYGSGGRGPALAGALTAACRGPESTFYNPAALAHSDSLSLFASVALFTEDLEAGVAGSVEDPNVGVSTGVATPIPLGGPLADRLFFGFVLHLPTDDARVIRIELPGLGEPFFLPYQNATERAIIATALGIRIVPGFRIGAGLEIHLLDSPNSVSGAVGRTGSFELSTDLELLGDYMPRIGLELDGTAISPALDAWSFGLVYRDSFKEDFALPADFDLGFPAMLELSSQTFFVPRELVAGAAWRPAPGWSLTTDLAWERWSELPSPRIRVAVVGLDGLLPDPSLAVLESPVPDPRVSDTVSPRLGLERDFRASDAGWPFVLRLGYAYEPSPGDPADDPLLFFNARHVVTLGLDWVVGEPWLEPDDPRLEIETYAQAHVLASERRFVPASLSPTDTDVTVTGRGWLGVYGIALRVTFP